MMQSDQLVAGPKRSKSKFELYDLGYCKDYGKVWNFQKELVEKRNLNLVPNSLIAVEHSHVITKGRNGHEDNILAHDLPVFSIERGGDVTYHGPGQLVVYPILSLTEYSLGVRQYVTKLEEVLVDALLHFGINAEGKLGEQTGIWVDGERKIASIGVATSHWTTYHGFALNVNSDLSYFQKIRPCGFDSKVMTSIEKELRHEIEFKRVKEEVLCLFSEIFGAELVAAKVQQF
jgi:lipoyl(octanoyl) transferase